VYRVIPALLALLLAAPAPASAVVGSKTDLDGDGASDKVRLEKREKDLWLVVERSSAGKAERLLGDQEIAFQLDGRDSTLVVKDVTGDGVAEVVVAATAAQRGFLYVLRLEGTSLRSLHPDAEAFVSETGSFPAALAIASTGRVTIAGLEHSEDAGPREALFTFEWNAKAKGYRLTATDLAEDD
jgi:hypothetical protein